MYQTFEKYEFPLKTDFKEFQLVFVVDNQR
jgi:hypothetical protein